MILNSYLQCKFQGTWVIFTRLTIFQHFPPKCGACVIILSVIDIILEYNIIPKIFFSWMLPLQWCNKGCTKKKFIVRANIHKRKQWSVVPLSEYFAHANALTTLSKGKIRPCVWKGFYDSLLLDFVWIHFFPFFQPRARLLA